MPATALLDPLIWKKSSIWAKSKFEFLKIVDSLFRFPKSFNRSLLLDAFSEVAPPTFDRLDPKLNLKGIKVDPPLRSMGAKSA